MAGFKLQSYTATSTQHVPPLTSCLSKGCLNLCNILVYIYFVQLYIYGEMNAQCFGCGGTDLHMCLAMLLLVRNNKGIAKLWGYPLMKLIASQLYSGIQHTAFFM